MTKNTKITTKTDFVLSLVSEDEVKDILGETFSSVMMSPAVMWAKFILTDSNTNANNQRVPEDEFPNLIRSGIFMPLKMAPGEIADGHEGSQPLGVIAHLKQEGNKLMALAALWIKERPADIQYIKDLVDNKEAVNISWELLFGDYSIAADGVMELKDLVLRAATIVGVPAYQGRTPILAVAAKKWSKAYIEALPAENFLLINKDGQRMFAYKDEAGIVDPSRFQPILDEVLASNLENDLSDQVRQQVRNLRELAESGTSLNELDTDRILLADLNTNSEEYNVEELEALKTQVANLTASLEAKSLELETLKSEKDAKLVELQAATDELNSLREFKSQYDAEQEEATKLTNVKSKFSDAGIEKDDEYFMTNSEHLLSLDEAGLDFFIQELVAFKDSSASTNPGMRLPNFQNQTQRPSIQDIVKGLNEHRSSK